MLIGIDASRANRSHKNGTEWYSYYLIRHLARLDDKNQYILYTDQPLIGGLLDLGSENFSRKDNKAEYDSRGFQKIKSPHNNFRAKILNWPIRNFWTLGRLSLECFFHRPDILFVPSHTLPYFAPSKSIVTIHDVGFAVKKSLYKNEPIGPVSPTNRKITDVLTRIFTFGRYGAEATDYLEWSTKHALKKARKIITVSNNSKKDIIDNFKVKADKIKVIYNGYNSDSFHKDNVPEKIKATLDRYGIEKPYFFYVGKIEKKKNIPALIESFAILKDQHPEIKHKLVLVGDAFYGYDEVHYIVHEFGLDNEVIMPGWVDETDMPLIYSGADAFVFPSNYEAFGVVLLEAMASGLPIAASGTASIPEVLGDAGLFFNPDDMEEIAHSLYRLASDSELREKLIKAGNERVKEFSWEKCARETLELISSL